MVKASEKVVKSVSANKGPKRKGSARKDRLAEEKKASSTTVTKFDSSPSDVIYVGHIPRGFEEREMRKFFAQFGDVQVSDGSLRGYSSRRLGADSGQPRLKRVTGHRCWFSQADGLVGH